MRSLHKGHVNSYRGRVHLSVHPYNTETTQRMLMKFGIGVFEAQTKIYQFFLRNCSWYNKFVHDIKCRSDYDIQLSLGTVLDT
jgi:hypothetical protein